LAVLNREEISKLLDYVDSEKKGFVNFADFSQKIHTNMAQENEMGEPKILSYVTPKKQQVTDLLLNHDRFKKTIFDITKALSPPKSMTFVFATFLIFLNSCGPKNKIWSKSSLVKYIPNFTARWKQLNGHN